MSGNRRSRVWADASTALSRSSAAPKPRARRRNSLENDIKDLPEGEKWPCRQRPDGLQKDYAELMHEVAYQFRAGSSQKRTRRASTFDSGEAGADDRRSGPEQGKVPG